MSSIPGLTIKKEVRVNLDIEITPEGLENIVRDAIMRQDPSVNVEEVTIVQRRKPVAGIYVEVKASIPGIDAVIAENAAESSASSSDDEAPVEEEVPVASVGKEETGKSQAPAPEEVTETDEPPVTGESMFGSDDDVSGDDAEDLSEGAIEDPADLDDDDTDDNVPGKESAAEPGTMASMFS